MATDVRPIVLYQSRTTSTCNVRALFISLTYGGTMPQSSEDLRELFQALQAVDVPIKEACVLSDDASITQRTGEPHHLNIVRHLRWLTEGAQPGDSLLLFYMGHGNRLSSEEHAIVPSDHVTYGQILNDELHDTLVRPLPKGVRLTAVMDCYHGARVLVLPWRCSDSAPMLAKLHKPGAPLNFERTMLPIDDCDGDAVIFGASCGGSDAPNFGVEVPRGARSGLTQAFATALRERSAALPMLLAMHVALGKRSRGKLHAEFLVSRTFDTTAVPFSLVGALPQLPFSAFKEQVLPFFKKVDPAFIGQLDADLDEANGDFAGWFTRMEAKYGGDKVATLRSATAAVAGGASSSSAPTPSPPNHREELMQYYHHYGAQKTWAEVDMALAKYQGKEEEMWTILQSKYGPRQKQYSGGVSPAPPPPPATTVTSPPVASSSLPTQSPPNHREELMQYYHHYGAQKTWADVDMALAKYQGREGDMWTQLESKYGPRQKHYPGGAPQQAPPTSTATPLTPPSLPTQSQPNHREALMQYYHHYGAQKTWADVDMALAKYQGKEEEMWKILEVKYGPRPPQLPSTTAAPPTPGGGVPMMLSAAAQSYYKPRLIRFYQHYAPAKVAEVDGILGQYAGQEESMFAQLVAKYGPEPGGPAPPPQAPGYGGGGYAMPPMVAPPLQGYQLPAYVAHGQPVMYMQPTVYVYRI